MALVNIRDLSRRASQVVGSVAKTRRPALITRRGLPIAALVPVDEEAAREALEDWVLANAPEFVRSMEEAERELAAGKAIPLDEFLRQEELARRKKSGRARNSTRAARGRVRRRA